MAFEYATENPHCRDCAAQSLSAVALTPASTLYLCSVLAATAPQSTACHIDRGIANGDSYQGLKGLKGPSERHVIPSVLYPSPRTIPTATPVSISRTPTPTSHTRPCQSLIAAAPSSFDWQSALPYTERGIQTDRRGLAKVWTVTDQQRGSAHSGNADIGRIIGHIGKFFLTGISCRSSPSLGG